MIYIIHPNVDVWNFVLKDIDDNINIVTRPLNRYCTKWQIAFRKIFPNSRSSFSFLFNGKMQRELNDLGEGDSLVLCDYRELCLVRTLSASLHPKVKKYFWTWNPIKTKNKEIFTITFDVMKKEGIIPSTFDPKDANYFDLQLHSQFFRMYLNPITPIKETIDFYFVGFPKDRENDLKILENQLSDFKTLFKIVHNSREYISYEENIKLAAQSRCLVEITQHQQTGMSLRPLEALALHKKLISNDMNLVKMDFYHPQNIFILGLDSIKDIHRFMEMPFVPIPLDIIQKYDVSTWIKNFM